MSRSLTSVAFVLLVVAGSANATTPADGYRGPRVLLVGMDGLSWNVADPLLAAGRMPHLAALMERGVHAALETVEPVISPTVWTSIATGRSPAAHGITSFFGDARSVRVPTIFERLAVQGVRVGLLEYLYTWPPRALPAGFVVPGWLRRDDTTAPGDAMERAGEPAYRFSNQEIRSRHQVFEDALEETATKPRQWRALVRAFEPEAGAVLLFAADSVSHRFWADSFPDEFDADDLPAGDPAHAGAVQRTYEALDTALGELVASLPEEGAILLLSDHGFRAGSGYARRWHYRIEEPLRRAGFEPGAQPFAIEGTFGFATLRIEPGPWQEREALLTRLEQFFETFTTQGGEPLFWVQPRRVAARPPEVPGRGFVEWVKEKLLRLLGWVLGIETDVENAHALLVLVPIDRNLESVWPDGEIRIAEGRLPARDLVFGDGFTGTHRDEAVFVAAGGGLRGLPERQDFSVLDVAALYAWLAGAAIPDDLEGRFPEDWIEPAALAARPPAVQPASGFARLPAPEAPAAHDADLVERLRGLGYVE